MSSTIDELFLANPLVGTSPFTPAHPSPNISVIVASPELVKKKGLNRCFSRKAGFTLMRCANSLDEIISFSRRLSPCVLIIGQELTAGPNFAESLREIRLNRGVQILVAGQQESPATVHSILRAGCVGFLETGASNYVLRRAVHSVAAGELWASRQSVSRLIQDFLMAESLAELSPREQEILNLIGQGYKNREIAEHLFISSETVHWHVRGLYAKIGVKDRLSAAVFASEHAGLSVRMSSGIARITRTQVAVT
jgi:DNA-binding NarL/FixJ family response regulator